jgi:release factor glutamine methyltransferase
MLTVLDIIKKTTDFLAAKGIESPRLNAELLIGHALQRKRMQLYLEFERPLAETELETIRPLVRRRAQHEPVQYILGETEFYGLKLKVDRRALIPRPETEQLVEHVIATFAAGIPPANILDLGVGSGAIALALAQAFPNAAVTGADLSESALALAGENAHATGLADRVVFLVSNWFSAVPATRFEVVVANPPYLSPEETAQTLPEVRGFEPPQALTAAGGGLADLSRIIADAPRFLTAGGLLALETGIAQHEQLLTLAREAGFSRAESKRDLTGRDRFVLAYM